MRQGSSAPSAASCVSTTPCVPPRTVCGRWVRWPGVPRSRTSRMTTTGSCSRTCSATEARAARTASFRTRSSPIPSSGAWASRSARRVTGAMTSGWRKIPMSRVARAVETAETRGFMKAVVDGETDRILGAAILGIEGGEVASAVQIAMMGGLRWQDLRDGVFSHPTLTESLNNLFATIEG
ncbi:MAG: hypothetical protein U5R14_14780 [Gemmatimonadota bacterium]|nr:hypothetical protein [Gemmatimonadota bacterium]